MDKGKARVFSMLGVLVLLATTLVPTTSSVARVAGAGSAAQPQTAPTPMSQGDLGKVQRDVTYCKGGDTDLKMDIYYPKVQSSLPAPAAVYVHGGGWTKGDKGGGEGIIDVAELVGRGYLVASINYRL